MIINEGYIGGVIDTNGGFYIFEDKYLYFKIGIKNQHILSVIYNYLKNKKHVNIRLYGRMYYITQYDSMCTFLKFLRKNCNRTDYIDLIKSHSLIYERYKSYIE